MKIKALVQLLYQVEKRKKFFSTAMYSTFHRILRLCKGVTYYTDCNCRLESKL